MGWDKERYHADPEYRLGMLNRQKKYREKFPEKIAEHNRLYWERVSGDGELHAKYCARVRKYVAERRKNDPIYRDKLRKRALEEYYKSKAKKLIKQHD